MKNRVMSEELVKKNDVINAFDATIYIKNKRDLLLVGYYVNHVLKKIKSLPTIEPKRGKWINEHEDGHGSWVGTCDQCYTENHVDNFCPHCGARMEETE